MKSPDACVKRRFDEHADEGTGGSGEGMHSDPGGDRPLWLRTGGAAAAPSGAGLDGNGDEQLLEYYFALGDEIDRCDRAGQRGSVGVGTGFGTGGVGFGIGVAQGVGGCSTQSLRERRVLVRRELIQRGLIQ
jgi:hypothetical protein